MNRPRRIKILLFVCTALWISASNSTASADEYRFVTFNYPPLEYEDQNRRPQGIAVNIVSHIMAAIGHRVRIEVYPWTRALDMVKNGRADAIFTAYKNEQREAFLDFSREVLILQEVYFFKRKNQPIEFAGDYQNLKKYTIGVVSTISYGPLFDAAKEVLDIDRSSRLEHGFQKLRLGRIDLLPSDTLVAGYTLKSMGLTGVIEALPPRIQSVPSYIAFSKRRQLGALRDQFDQQLIEMKASGVYDAMVATLAGGLNR